MAIIETRSLVKTFGKIQAVRGIDLAIESGEIFGLLGPNGAGKTTTIGMLCTIIRPTSGQGMIAGFDVAKSPTQVRRKVGIVFQDPTLDTILTGRENLQLHARLYGIPASVRHLWIDEMLALVDLRERADDLTKTYSGGMRRRLELAQALVHDPEVLFLDEPTIGLDVSGRRKIWEHIISLKNGGMTVFVTTHYMDEADHACDRVGIIDKGRIVALDTPSALKSLHCHDIIAIRGEGEYHGTIVPDVTFIGKTGDELRFKAISGEDSGIPLLRALSDSGLKVQSVVIRQPTLDDVFLSLIGDQDETVAFDHHRFRTMLRRRA
jgi:ABC-2 type transport system ATP-binding protein